MAAKIRRIRSFLIYLLVFLTLTSILMIIPRIIALVYPERSPVGYSFIAADYLAVWLNLERVVNMHPQVPSDIEELKDIEYKKISGRSLLLDICRPRDNQKALPLLVFIHGGAWRNGRKSDYLGYLVSYAKKGYCTASVSYRLLEDAPYPACVEDVKDAVRWLFRHGNAYGYDPDRIAIIGGSAGAHLAMLAAFGWKNHNADSSGQHHIHALVDIYGPSDLTTKYARNHHLVKSFLAATYEKNPAVFREASPIIYVTRSAPPTLILHGTSDHLVPISQSEKLKEKLDSLGVPVEMYRLPLWPHAMDIIQRVNDYMQLKMDDFFEKYLREDKR